jgi:hypothetical protein
MSLSEVIAKLKPDESVKFTRSELRICIVAKKGDQLASHNEISIFADSQTVEHARVDVLAIEVRRAFHILRRSEATDGN